MNDPLKQGNARPLTPQPDLGIEQLPFRLRHLRDCWPTGTGAPRLTIGGSRGVFFDRWSSVNEAPFELRLEPCVEEHVFSLPLKRSTVVYNIGKKLITDNETFPGQPFLNGPIPSSSRKVYVDGFDVFRLSVSNRLLAERLRPESEGAVEGQVHLFGPHVSSDRMIRELLIAGAQASNSGDDLYLESVGIALAEYVATRFTRGLPVRQVSPLSKARLRRVKEYIDNNLGRRITLAELSAVAGLNRPHFGAQFKVATGQTPYAYVIRRRLRAAQSLLTAQTLSIDDIALSVGFNNATHFVAAFRKYVGQTPSRWRKSIASGRAVPPVFAAAKS